MRLCLLQLLLGVARGATVWELAFESHPDPGKRDLDGLDYFVVEADDPHDIAATHGWTVEEAFPIRNHWLLSEPKSRARLPKRSERAFELGARGFYDSPISSLRKRAPIPENLDTIKQEFNITDPLFKDQWHIWNPVERGHDMNVVPVWRRNITGKGVTVAIVDDGLDYDHPDFEHTFSKDGSWDYNNHQQLPKPLLPEDTHGTRCAGEIAAGINNACGVGVAPNAKVAGIRILSDILTTADEARALIHRYNINDIYSCSWGPTDNGQVIDGPPPLVKRAEVDGIENGRNGKGSIYVVASGNGDMLMDNCNYDGYTNSIYSITVGAIDRQNEHPYYAESCSANMVVTYSSNSVDKITTSDRLDPQHPDQVKCTNLHSGTSAAAPIAAGIFALVLEQRPDLTWRDLQYLVRDTAKSFEIMKSPSSNPKNRVTNDWQITADGHRYHNSYGYGLLDADAIVRRAETWELVKPATWYFLPEQRVEEPITPSAEVAIDVSAEDWQDSNLDHIEHIRVRVSYSHQYRGLLHFQLESPAGVVSDLAAPRLSDKSFAPVDDWEFLSVVHWNETGQGQWKLRVVGSEGTEGVLRKWQLKFFGQARDVSKVSNYSEVFNQYDEAVPLVHDAFETSSSSSSHSSNASPDPTAHGGQDGETTNAAEPATVTGTPSTASDPNATNTLPPAESPSPGAAEKPSYSSQHWHHSLFYYIAVSLIGIGIIVAIATPVVLCYLKRRAARGENSRYASLDDEFADEFELDSAEEVDAPFDVDDEDEALDNVAEGHGGQASIP